MTDHFYDMERDRRDEPDPRTDRGRVDGQHQNWVQNEMTGGHDDLGTNWNVTWNSTSVENKMTDAHEHQNKNWNFWECLNWDSQDVVSTNNLFAAFERF